MKTTILFFIIFVSYSAVKGQITKSIDQAFQQADSVVLVSHKSVWASMNMPPGELNDSTRRGLLFENKLNEQIIVERHSLTKRQSVKLLHLLQLPVNYPPFVGGCFDPHHAVLLYKAGKISYIHICFNCHNFYLSSDIKSFYFDMDKVKTFYKQSGLKYELSEK